MLIGSILAQAAQKRTGSRPVLFDLARASHRRTLEVLWKHGEIKHVVDDYHEQLKELFQVENPTLVYQKGFEAAFKAHLKKLSAQKGGLAWSGNWVFFPWNDTLVHLLPEEQFQRVRTARNRNLISEKEQRQFYQATIGIGGLSVGNSVALAIVLQGGARRIRLADFDRLSLSNLNRIRGDTTSLGLRKVEMTARQIYVLNPYAIVETFPEGLRRTNIARFFAGPPKLDLVIDEIDNLAVKLLIRQEARRRKVPVLMGADNGDNAVVDIERYDLDPKLRFFHHRLGNPTFGTLSKLDKFGIGRTITKHIGPENVTERMQASLLEIGKTIVSWPQLGGAALLNGVGVAYCARKILSKQPLEKDRALLSLDEKFEPAYFSKRKKLKRSRAAASFKKIFKL